MASHLLWQEKPNAKPEEKKTVYYRIPSVSDSVLFTEVEIQRIQEVFSMPGWRLLQEIKQRDANRLAAIALNPFSDQKERDMAIHAHASALFDITLPERFDAALHDPSCQLEEKPDTPTPPTETNLGPLRLGFACRWLDSVRSIFAKPNSMLDKQ